MISNGMLHGLLSTHSPTQDPCIVTAYRDIEELFRITMEKTPWLLGRSEDMPPVGSRFVPPTSESFRQHRSNRNRTNFPSGNKPSSATPQDFGMLASSCCSGLPRALL